MAKKKQSNQPGEGAAFAPEISQPPGAPGTGPEATARQEVENPAEPPAAATDESVEGSSSLGPQLAGEVQIQIPLAEVQPEGVGYVRRHLDGRLDATQAAALHRVARGLDAQGARLANGRRPDGAIDAVRCILERVAAAANGSG